MTLANLRRTRSERPSLKTFIIMVDLFLRLYQDLHSSLTTIQSPTKSTLFTPDKQHFMFFKNGFSENHHRLKY